MSTKGNRRVRVYRWGNDNIEVVFGNGILADINGDDRDVSFEHVSRASMSRLEALVMQAHPVLTYTSFNSAYASVHLDFRYGIQ